MCRSNYTFQSRGWSLILSRKEYSQRTLPSTNFWEVLQRPGNQKVIKATFSDALCPSPVTTQQFGPSIGSHRPEEPRVRSFCQNQSCSAWRSELHPCFLMSIRHLVVGLGLGGFFLLFEKHFICPPKKPNRFSWPETIPIVRLTSPNRIR